MNKVSTITRKTLLTGLIELTPEQAYELGKDYNAQIWKQKIDRYKALGAEFYYIPKDNNCYHYDRYFVKYYATGILFFASFGYSSCLTSRGFTEVEIEGDTLIGVLYLNENLERLSLKNCPESRRDMAIRSGMLGTIYTNDF